MNSVGVTSGAPALRARLRRLDLARSAAPSWREGAIALGVMLVVGILAFLPHLRHGGFYYDDWANGAYTRYAGGTGGLDNVLHYYWNLTKYRPVLVVYVPLTHIVFGTHMKLHLLWSMGLGALESSLLYLLLRTLGIARVHAGLIGILVLVYPWTDSTRLWATASMTSLAISFYLAGAILAVLALQGRFRHRWAAHSGAGLLYALSVGTYEATAGLVVFSFFLYCCVTGWRRALRRSAFDVAVLAAMLLIFTSKNAHTVQSAHTQVVHAWTITKQGLVVLAQSAVPVGHARRLPVLLPMLAIVGLAVWRWRVTKSADLRRWLIIAALSLVATVAGYVVFVPADPYYSPLTLGLGNRTNVVAALGFIPLIYSIAALAGLLLFERAPGGRRAGLAVASLVAVLIGVGYLHELRADEGRWDRAYTMEAQALGVMRGAVPHPPPNSTLYSFDWPGFATPGVTVFSSFWDLNGAVKLQWHDATLQGYPVLAAVTCGPKTVKVPADPSPKPYGNVFFIDIASGDSVRIRSRAQCAAVTQQFHPGVAVAAPS